MGTVVKVPGCQKLQITAQPGLAQDALYLYTYGNSGCQRVKDSAPDDHWLRYTESQPRGYDSVRRPGCIIFDITTSIKLDRRLLTAWSVLRVKRLSNLKISTPKSCNYRPNFVPAFISKARRTSWNKTETKHWNYFISLAYFKHANNEATTILKRF